MARIIRRIAAGLGLLVAVGLAALAIALSYDSRCGAPPAVAEGATTTEGTTTMKAAVRRCYGPPDVLAVEDVEKPVYADNQMLVKVHAAALNPLDWHELRGTPYIMRIGAGFGTPKVARLGIDFSGTVEAVGKNVSRYKPGDEIFGGRSGALAEYLALTETGSIAHKPANITHEQAAGVYVAALTAIQTLRDRAAIQPGQKVLINGASGGVGTLAVQIAKALGAEVTGVCSTRNIELVRSLGADHVIDYTAEDFTQSGERYDVIMDNVANRPILDIRRVLAPHGKYLVIGGGGPEANPWIGAFKAPIKAWFISLFVDQDLAFFLSHASTADIVAVAGLIEEGKVVPVVDREYPLAQIEDAMRYLETGRARGKVVVTMD
jgi:NADPH:quinone reductase-like Zn-dependent oxidoreductase